MRARLAALLAVVFIAVPAAGTAQQAKVFRYAFPIAETGFDPAQITDLYSRTVTPHIFDALYRYDHLARPFKIKPNTAAAMPEVSPDFRVWTVKLTPGIYFQDDPAFRGKRRELTAQDYVYSFKRFYDPRWKSPNYPRLSEEKIVGVNALRHDALKTRKPFDYEREVEGLRALDRYTVQFKLEESRPRFIHLLALGDLYGAVAREVIEMYGDDITAHPIGTGPFRLAEWRRSSRIVLERNPTFREVFYDAEPNAEDAEGQALLQRFRGRRLPMIDRVEVSIIEEQQPRWLSFLNRQQDLIERIANEFINIAAPNGKLAPNLQRQGMQLYRVLGSDLTMSVYNMDHPVLGGYTPERVALRRAINLATNTGQEIRLVRKNQAIAAQSPTMPNTIGFDAEFRSENGQYDLARAKALLDMYGYVDRDSDGWRDQPDGQPLVLEVSSEPSQANRQLAEMVRKDMGLLGIRTDFRIAQWPENLKNSRAGKYMMWRVGLSADSPDGQPILDRGSSAHIGGQNLSRFKNAEFDAIYNKMRELPDGPERLQLFDQAKRLLIAYAPYKWGVHRIYTDIAHSWLHGYRRPPYWTDWWQYIDIDAEAQAKAIQ
ncbi:MAG: ABC transporter substrate-binding protein [Burkholderiaceae bacterium]